MAKKIAAYHKTITGNFLWNCNVVLCALSDAKKFIMR